jgi:hypothetical protein
MKPKAFEWWTAAALIVIVAAVVALSGCGGDQAPAAIAAPGPHVAPEIDPAGAVVGLTFLAGLVAVIRGRR